MWAYSSIICNHFQKFQKLKDSKLFWWPFSLALKTWVCDHLVTLQVYTGVSELRLVFWLLVWLSGFTSNLFVPCHNEVAEGGYWIQCNGLIDCVVSRSNTGTPSSQMAQARLATVTITQISVTIQQFIHKTGVFNNNDYVNFYHYSCEPFYYGHPELPEGTCTACYCHNNTDLCDHSTGECLGCGYNTTGHNCERCADGFYGNATLRECKGEVFLPISLPPSLPPSSP